MFIFAELFRALAMLVDGICWILYWLLLARIVISWFPVDPYHAVVQFLFQATEPILALFRKVPLRFGTMDFTPLLAFITLIFVKRVLVTILLTLAHQFSSGAPVPAAF